MAKQYVARHSLTRGANQAANLNANRTIAEHVLNETKSLITSEAAKGPVQLRRATVAFTVGNIQVHEGQFFHFVASTVFERRFYVVVANVRESALEPIVYKCSASDERVARKCINAVKATREARDFKIAA